MRSSPKDNIQKEQEKKTEDFGFMQAEGAMFLVFLVFVVFFWGWGNVFDSFLWFLSFCFGRFWAMIGRSFGTLGVTRVGRPQIHQPLYQIPPNQSKTLFLLPKNLFFWR